MIINSIHMSRIEGALESGETIVSPFTPSPTTHLSLTAFGRMTVRHFAGQIARTTSSLSGLASATLRMFDLPLNETFTRIH